MLELNLIDGKKIYIPLAKVVQISEGDAGVFVVAAEDGSGGTAWHNAVGFSILREGQKITR